MTRLVTPGTFASRLLALSLFIAMLLGIVALIVVPYVTTSAERTTQLERTRSALSGYAAELARLRALEEQGGPQQANSGDDLLFEAPSEAIASAKVQQAIRTAFQTVEADLGRLQFLPARPLNGAQQLSIRIETTLDLAALQSAFHAMETQTPALFVESLDIRRKVRPKADQIEPENRELIAQATLFGLWAGP